MFSLVNQSSREVGDKKLYSTHVMEPRTEDSREYGTLKTNVGCSRRWNLGQGHEQIMASTTKTGSAPEKDKIGIVQKSCSGAPRRYLAESWGNLARF